MTFGYLEQIPQREAIKERLTELWNYERFGAPSKEGGRYFFSRNDGLQNQSVLYTLDVARRPSRACCSTRTRCRATARSRSPGSAVSDDGKLLAYGLAAAGSDWQEWQVRDVDDRQGPGRRR